MIQVPNNTTQVVQGNENKWRGQSTHSPRKSCHKVSNESIQVGEFISHISFLDHNLGWA